MKTLLTLARKDLRLLWRDRFGLFWVIVFPLLMALFFGSIFSTGGARAGSMKIAAVDELRTEQSRQMIGKLSAKPVLAVTPLPLDSARLLVQKGKLTAYVLLKRDSLATGEGNPFAMPPIEIGLDPSRKAEAGYLQGMVTEAWFSLMQDRLADPAVAKTWVNEGLAGLRADTALPPDQRGVLTRLLASFDDYLTTFDSAEVSQSSPFGKTAITVVEVAVEREGPRSPFEITFPQALTWALLGCALTFAQSIVSERQRGTYLRLRLAPITRGQILAGKGLACFVTSGAVSVALLAVGVLIFGVRVAFPLGMAIALAAAGCCFVGLMMLISVLGRTEQAVSGAGWAIMLVMAMAGGSMVPLMVMPSWMLTVSNFSVVKWAIYAYEGAIWRGFTLGQMLVPAGILTAIGAIAFALGVAILARTDR
ncbi:MAG TPA: ABC transporter permease [candidate division Zixibacteria bacterium]|nr:ABC transporter permease [candidate division Zixibacteria bacterium]MDM7972117.1 ABC transporter permease [candidate division Zixibacteria bacterium]HOD66769.1 ABC transporter permease [candidate division Zixibacteria bacterium]HPI31775.1 ABC transporter permease [candidate division Zixibacteria bacterium]HPM36996.1 ABC transporter permease [candidate division Zixibacteria bacterium]